MCPGLQKDVPGLHNVVTWKNVSVLVLGIGSLKKVFRQVIE